jgi:hypothetical protein
MKLLNNSENLFIKLLHWPYIGNLDPENAACGPENLFRKPALWLKKQEQKFTNVREEKKPEQKIHC